MFLFKKENSLANHGSLKNALLELSYYNSLNHPEKDPNIVWANPISGYSSKELSDETGIIKNSIDYIIELVEDELKVTVNSNKAYAQYYTQTETEGNIYSDYVTGYTPEYQPNKVALVYLGHDGWDSTIEFWNINISKESKIFENSFDLKLYDLLVYDTTLPHRFKPTTWGNHAGDSGLMLTLFLNTT